mgnify:CR=1 FL=1
MNYYNEHDPKASAWLRELISEGLISEGEVDDRSVEDVTPGDLRGFQQCHFFAGIGIWSHALRQAGWPDDKPVWTGSCPCQPFSAAGKGAGVADERHLWPAFAWLIRQCRPDVIFGEQVAHKAGAAWFDIVSADLEREGYACGQVVFPACSVGAPHLRQRQYWVGYSSSEGLPQRNSGEVSKSREIERLKRSGPPSQLADADCGKCDGEPDGKRSERDRPAARRVESDREPPAGGEFRGVAGTASERRNRITNTTREAGRGCSKNGSEASGPCPTNGFWAGADWLGCTDGKRRAVEPGTFPLAHGAPARVGRLRGYGNAIVAPQAQAFIEAYQLIN